MVFNARVATPDGAEDMVFVEVDKGMDDGYLDIVKISKNVYTYYERCVLNEDWGHT